MSSGWTSFTRTFFTQHGFLILRPTCGFIIRSRQVGDICCDLFDIHGSYLWDEKWVGMGEDHVRCYDYS